MNIPAALKHKPVFVVNEYDRIDGANAGNSDAKGLSLGLAQWNDRGKVDISAKVWRYTGEKWSRQSEELPLNRVLDLTIFMLESIRFLKEDSAAYPEGFDPAQPSLSKVEIQDGAMDVSVCTDNPMVKDDLQLFKAAYAAQDEYISERLHIIADLLRASGY